MPQAKAEGRYRAAGRDCAMEVEAAHWQPKITPCCRRSITMKAGARLALHVGIEGAGDFRAFREESG